MVLYGGSPSLYRSAGLLMLPPLVLIVVCVVLGSASGSSIATYSLPVAATTVQQQQQHHRVEFRLSTLEEDHEQSDNETAPLKITESQQWAICGAWINASNNLYFHVVYALLLFAFLAPANNCGWIWLRAAVVCASIVMFYAAWFHECDREKFIWAMLIFFVNFLYLSIGLIKLRPLKFDKEIECVSNIKLYIESQSIN